MVVCVYAQPNITRVEYFYDTDPGFGNGTPVTINPASNIADISFNANLTSLNEGLHNLFIRSRDANGKWSLTNRFLFVRRSATTAAANITKAEYFWDTDPGFGNAINIPVTPGVNLENISIEASIAALPEGLHNLYLRSRDANGKWSVTNRFLFYRSAPALTAPPVHQVEYFIDTDPGFGKGVPIAINAAQVLPDFGFPVNITGLATGDHKLYIRSRNNTGKWSITNIIEFPIGTLAASPYIQVNSATRKMMCGDSKFNMAFHATGNFNQGNVFNVQLSDASGNFAAPTIIGSIAGTSSAVVECTVPLHIPNGNAYRIRVVSTNPIITGVTSDTVFVLNDQPRYPDTEAYIICQGETYNLNTVYNTTGFTTLWNTGNPAAGPAGNYQVIATNTAGTLGCKDTAVVTVKQDIATWTGATSNNWHTASNWSNGKIPAASTHVIIPNGTITCILSNADAVVASIQVKNGTGMQTLNGRKVTVVATCNPLPQ
jgi:hypothetical protein